MPATLELCPRCGRNQFTPYGTPREEIDWENAPLPALSRIDNETYICTPCGQDEAMRDWQRLPPVPPDRWPIAEQGFREVNQ